MLYYLSAYSSATTDIIGSFFSLILIFIALSVAEFVIQTSEKVVPRLTYSFIKIALIYISFFCFYRLLNH